MADILINGMKMPKNCAECPMEHYECWMLDDFVTDYFEGDKRHPDCPLIELPDHGRLIDADALHKLFEDQWHYLQVLDWNENPTAEATQSGINWCINTMHDDAPTIIPAEEVDNG